ncbi:transcription factor bHLH36-like isoform X1 [Macadamia integrifolia]|uniref:transcription factor bHLH36-like isoform X1 n=1 Tax=Macadamia integrifolia TaxID=60698 RepID=UPI001C4F8903|nr:transcription factor bHLH36-like isoform X1 [Macadamia integrifolia]
MGERPKRRDFIPPNPIFPFQQGHHHDLFFQPSSTYPSLQQNDPPHNHTVLPMSPSLDFTDPPPSATPNSFDETCNEKIKKRIMHRDLERQRRQEMTTLYASLRSLLPLQYLKGCGTGDAILQGKRAISDHMNEAANYIRDLRKRIQELSAKRDKLRKRPNSGAPDVAVVVTGNYPPRNCVIVQPCLGGVEVVISSGLRNGELPLSRVLRVIVDYGFCIISCVSTRVDERSLHTIHSEVSDDLTDVDLSRLQQILTDLISSPSS